MQQARRTIRYQEIAADIRSRITDGEFAPGALLPSESALSTRYSASRVTIRRALEALRSEQLVDSRQGFGWFVATDPLRQQLHQLGTIESQLSAAGMSSERRILSFRFVEASERVRAVLAEDQVLEVQRLNLADGQPFALVTVWCPESLGSELSRADLERSTFLEQLPVKLGGARQTIGAEAADADVGVLLDVPVGSPLLVVERVTSTTAGQPVLMSRHVFAAHRTEFTVDLPVATDELGPTGLRFVE